MSTTCTNARVRSILCFKTANWWLLVKMLLVHLHRMHTYSNTICTSQHRTYEHTRIPCKFLGEVMGKGMPLYLNDMQSVLHTEIGAIEPSWASVRVNSFSSSSDNGSIKGAHTTDHNITIVLNYWIRYAYMCVNKRSRNGIITQMIHTVFHIMDMHMHSLG